MADEEKPVNTLNSEDLIQLGSELIIEINRELKSDRWAITNHGSENQKYLTYNAASLRQCVRLLEELMFAAQNSQEMTLRIVGRAHIESFIYGLYLHHGGYPALERIMANAKHMNLEGSP